METLKINDFPAGQPVSVCLSAMQSSGGVFKSVCSFANALDGRIISFTPSATNIEAASDGPNILHVPIGCGTLSQLYAAPKGGAELRKAQALASGAPLLTCHIFFRNHVNFVSQLSKVNGSPYLAVPHGCLDPWVFTYRRCRKLLWMKAYGQAFLRRAKAVICATKREADKARPWLSKSRVEVVHWPVKVLTRNETIRQKVRATCGISSDSHLLLWLGRVHHMKRPLETIRAWARALSVRNDKRSVLVIVGPEDTVRHNDLLKAAKEANISKQLVVAGSAWGPDRDAWLMAADGLVSFSRRENFGHMAAEALGAGIPVILGQGVDLAPELPPDVCWRPEADIPDHWISSLSDWLLEPVSSLTQRGIRGQQWAASALSESSFREKIRAIGLSN